MIPISSEPRRLHPAAMLGESLRALPGALIGLAGSATMARDQGIGILLLIGGLVLVAAGFFSFLSWWRFRYTIGTGEIVIERGVLSRQRRVIPFDRVQDVGLERRVLDRLIGTARVRIETGGSAADEGDLKMVALDEAHALRDLIRRRGEEHRPDPAAPAAAPADEPIVFALGVGRLLLSGALNFSLLFVALAFGAVQYLDDMGLVDIDDLIDGADLEARAGEVGIGAVLTLLLAILLLGMVTGLVRTVVRDFGFTLTAGATGLRRRRGLLTLSEMVIPARRTQAARVTSGWLSGQFGWRSLAFQTLGADPKDGGVQEAAPFATDGEVATILARAGFPQAPERPALRRASLRSLVRRTAPWLLLALLLAAAGLPFQLWWLGLGPLAVALIEVQRWRRHRYAVGDQAVAIADGLVGGRLWIIPYEKLQTLAVIQGPLQRPLGLASLAVDTAGAPGFGAPRLIDLPQDQAEALAADLLVRFHAARRRLRALPPEATLRPVMPNQNNEEPNGHAA